MDSLINKMSFKVNQKIFIKDPESSELGRKIICGSIDLIEKSGFEQFNFRKLAKNISSTEASIYRYFESKHKLLIYLNSWYWSWKEYQLLFSTANITSAKKRLEIAIELITSDIVEDKNIKHINEAKLHNIIISESSKAYLNREVDIENRKGAFKEYKEFVKRVSNIILEINKDFKYPHMLVSTIIEGAHSQRYFAAHLPRLTNINKGEDSILEFYKQMAFQTIQIKDHK